VIFSYSQGAVRRAAHLEIGLGQQLARRINNEARALLLEYFIETEIYWIPVHSGILENEEADCQANVAREGRGSTIREQSFISAANRARRITEWEEKRMSRHYGYRNGKAGSRRPITKKSKKSLASRYF
jgi:hypothetical protein